MSYIRFLSHPKCRLVRGGAEALCKDASLGTCTRTCPLSLKPLSAWCADASHGCSVELVQQEGRQLSNVFMGEELKHEGHGVS